MTKDLSVNGPGSPISLKKFLKSHPTKEITLLVDGAGAGIEKNAPGIMYITPKECEVQAKYYQSSFFDGQHIPVYLDKYLRMMYESETKEGDSHKFLCNLIKYCPKNPEAMQVIGLIQLVAGSLSAAKKANAGIKLYLEHPEANLHPKRQAAFMSVLMKLKEEYK